MEVQKVDQPDLKQHDSSVLDLAFAMDCTGSMGSYIRNAQRSIHKIVEEIVSKEKSDIHLALVEYRDHPPQERSFVTRPHDFTHKVGQMKKWLDDCSASGGGDTPEAVADGLHQVLKLSWRDEATKICVFIADAPPHGLMRSGDGFPNGCPDGIDPVVVANHLAEKGITVYMVGCEPSINPYKDFFMAVAHTTGGQYVPLGNADLLAQVIIGGAQEEISLQRLMEEVNLEVMEQCAAAGEDDIDEDMLSRRVHDKLKTKKTKQLRRADAALPEATERGKKWSNMTSMAAIQQDYIESEPAADMHQSARGAPRSKGASKRKAAAPASSSGGFFSSLRSFGRGSSAKEEARTVEALDVVDGSGSDDEMDHAAPCPGGAPKMPVAEESYEVMDQCMDMNQAQRMVKRSIATNQLRKKK